jgi:hypothetical protein
MRKFAIAFFLAMLLSITGCILGPFGASQLSPEQIAALKDYNGNVYACILAEGGTRNGAVVLILLPKDAKLNIQFNADCHIK